VRNTSTYHEEDNVKTRILLSLYLFMAIGILVACESEPDPEYLAYLLSRTQTAMAAEKVAENTPTPTEEPYSRCDLFADEELSVVLYSINPWDTNLKMYVKFKNGAVIGLEDGRDDGLSWDYSVKIGEVESIGCDIFEGETYAGRLYCILPLPPEYKDAARPAVFRVNGCTKDLLTIPLLSLTMEKVAGSGGSGGSGGTAGGSLAGKLPKDVFKLCGDSPGMLEWQACSCSSPDSYIEEWCNCMGGSITCVAGSCSCDIP
jgi:hypothetical protein